MEKKVEQNSERRRWWSCHNVGEFRGFRRYLWFFERKRRKFFEKKWIERLRWCGCYDSSRRGRDCDWSANALINDTHTRFFLIILWLVFQMRIRDSMDDVVFALCLWVAKKRRRFDEKRRKQSERRRYHVGRCGRDVRHGMEEFVWLLRKNGENSPKEKRTKNWTITMMNVDVDVRREWWFVAAWVNSWFLPMFVIFRNETAKIRQKKKKKSERRQWARRFVMG